MNRFAKIIPALAVLLLLCGCGKKSEIIPADLAIALNESVSFSEALAEIDGSSAGRRYNISSGDYDEITAFVGTPSTCDEFVIVKTSDTDAITEKLNSYLDYKRGEYDEYRPYEASKLESAIIETYHDAVVMIITEDEAVATEAYNEYLKD